MNLLLAAIAITAALTGAYAAYLGTIHRSRARIVAYLMTNPSAPTRDLHHQLRIPYRQLDAALNHLQERARITHTVDEAGLARWTVTGDPQ